MAEEIPTIGALLKNRLEKIIVQNEMLRAGFAALPYMLLRDTRLSLGARLTYAELLSYAWQEGSCFPGQERMAKDMGIGKRTLRRFLAELRDHGYISWKKLMPGGSNTYFIHDVKTKLQTEPRKRKAEAMGPPVAPRSGHDGPVDEAASDSLIDKENRPREIDSV
jgi:hypothetical protein